MDNQNIQITPNQEEIKKVAQASTIHMSTKKKKKKKKAKPKKFFTTNEKLIELCKILGALIFIVIFMNLYLALRR